MQTLLTILHLMLALGLIGLVLIQHGRGADAGAAFGSGASATVFGARGSGNFLSRSTGILATLFFLTSMALAFFAAHVGEPRGLMDEIDLPAPPRERAVVPAPEQGEVTAPPVVDMPATEVPVDLPPADLPMVPEARPVDRASDLPSVPGFALERATPEPVMPASSTDDTVVEDTGLNAEEND